MVRLYIVAANDFGESLRVVTSKAKVVALGSESEVVFFDVSAGKVGPDGDATFELAGAKVGDVVYVGHFSTDLGDSVWITAPYRTDAEAAAAAKRLAVSVHLPEEVRRGGGELRTIRLTIE